MYIQVVYVRNAISMAYEINRNNCFYCVLLTIYSIQLTINDVLYTLYRKIYRILCMSQLHFQISRMFLTAYRILLPLCSYCVVHRQVLSVQKGLCVRVYMSLLYICLLMRVSLCMHTSLCCTYRSLCACIQVTFVYIFTYAGFFAHAHDSLLYIHVSLYFYIRLFHTYRSLRIG